MMDLYFVFFTGFAIFGMYCALDTLYKLFTMNKMSVSVTIVKNNDDITVNRKIKYPEDTVPNNYILKYPSEENISLNDYIAGIFTNN